MRPPSRKFSKTAGAGQERIPPTEHLRALHRGGGRSLQPDERGKAFSGKAQRTAAKNCAQENRGRTDRCRPWKNGQRSGGSSPFDHPHRGGNRRRRTDCHGGGIPSGLGFGTYRHRPAIRRPADGFTARQIRWEALADGNKEVKGRQPAPKMKVEPGWRKKHGTKSPQ